MLRNLMISDNFSGFKLGIFIFVCNAHYREVRLLKVLVINWRDIEHPQAGGAETHIHEVLKRKPAHWQVDFIASKFRGCALQTSTPFYNIERIGHNFWFHLSFAWKWFTTLRHRGYHLIIDDVSKIPLLTPLYIKKTPVIAILHHIHGDSVFRELNPIAAFAVMLQEKYFLKAYRKTPLLVVSESTRKELAMLDSFTKVEVCYNGVDLDVFRGEFPAKSELPLICYLGRLKKYKRVDHVIHAFAKVKAKYPHAKLCIGGKGDDALRLQVLVRNLGLTKAVEFAGFVSEDDKKRLLSQSWIYAIASSKEGWGISVIEANACYTPAVGYNVAGLRDSIKHNVTGFTANDEDIDGLADCMCKIMESKNMRTQMSHDAYLWAASLDWQKMGPKWIQKINKAAGLPQDA
jgi:glycosyltransferase involved in cell wall biosynthesis